MIAAACFRIGRQQITFSICLPCELKVSLERIRVIVRVNEVLAGVVGRVNVDKLDASKVGLEQQLQNLQIVALYKNISRCLKVDGLFGIRHERAAAWSLQQRDSIVLTRPAEMKSTWA